MLRLLFVIPILLWAFTASPCLPFMGTLTLVSD